MFKSLFIAVAGLACVVWAAEIPTQTVDNVTTHEVRDTPVPALHPSAGETPKNVIFMIGDGMGVEQVSAAWICNKGKLYITKMPVTGLSKTYSASHVVTDSAAGGTALACGQRTNNSWLGLAPDRQRLVSLADTARSGSMATGLIVTKDITDATPAAFYAHIDNRRKDREIAKELAATPFNVIIGGGASHFSPEQMKQWESAGTLVHLDAPKHLAPAPERGNYLPEKTAEALAALQDSPNGFFLMIEGSQIDQAGHDHNLAAVVHETLEFDRTIGVVLAWMESHPDTLLVITADHQTGGLVILDGSIADGRVTAAFGAEKHNGMMVPVYAAGLGATLFTGVLDNIGIAEKIRSLLPQNADM